MARKIGIMQGRLSPPVGEAIQAFPLATWREEFTLARQTGLNHIEWIFDREDFLNPLANGNGIDEMLALSARTGVQINSLCADYFMSELLLSGSAVDREARVEKLAWLLAQCARARIHHVVLPFVDHACIEGDAGREHLVDLMHSLRPVLTLHRVELHLETSLAPVPFAALLEEIGSSLVKINYDTGNSAFLGYHPEEEFAAYGRWIGSVHLKDRLRGGVTVPLGHGDVDFPGVIRLLQEIDYRDDFTLQVARDKPGSEMLWARQHLDFWQDLISNSLWTSN